MNFKNNLSRLSALAVLSISFFLIFNFVTNKQDALALNKAGKHNVEVFKTPSCGCCYGYVKFLEEEKFTVKQTNTSLSAKGSVRGIHYALVPPSQAKYVQCQKGSIMDYVIDNVWICCCFCRTVFIIH